MRTYTKKQLSAILNVSMRTIQYLIKRGEIRYFRVGSVVRITEDALNDYIKEHEQNARAL